MPFLSLNGWTVPVRSGSFGKKEDVDGDTQRPFSGGQLEQNQISIRDTWNGRTKIQGQADSAALRGLLLGQGDHWALSGSPFTSGLGQEEIPTTVAPVEIAVAVGGGDPVFNSKQFTQAVRVAQATTNLADNRDLNGVAVTPTFAAVGNDATNFINGTASRKITFTAGGVSRIIFVAFSSPSTLTDYTASIYIRGDGGTQLLKVFLQQQDAFSGASVIFLLRDQEWQHIENISITTTAGVTRLDLVIEEVVLDTLAVFEMDGFQVEQKEYSTTFLDSASPRAAGKLEFSAGILAATDAGISVMFWTRGPNLQQNTGSRNAYWLAGVAATYLAIYNDSGVDNLHLETLGVAGAATKITHTGLWDGNWHHIAVVVRFDPTDGIAERELYVNGVSVASDSPGTDELPTGGVIGGGSIYIGNGALLGAIESNAPIEDLVVLPYAASASMVTAFAAYSRAQSNFPLLLAEGDFDSRVTVDVLGEPLGADFIEAAIDEGFRGNSAGLAFELDEA